MSSGRESISEVQSIMELVEAGQLEEASIRTNESPSLSSKVIRIRVLQKMGKLEEANELAIELKSRISELPKIILFVYQICYALVLWRLGELNQAMEYLDQAEDTHESIEEKEDQEIRKWRGLYYLILGSLYHDKGDIESAEAFYLKSLDIREKLDNRRDLAVINNNLGNVYTQQGQLNKALEFFYNSLAIYQEGDNEIDLASCMGNIGIIAHLRGNLKQAESYLSACLSTFEKANLVAEVAHTLENLGMINYQSGKLHEAKAQLNQCLKLKESIGNDIQTANTLFYLIQVLLDLEQRDRAQKYLERLQQINSSLDNPRVNLFYRLSKAIILKTSNRTIQISQAQQIFTDISKGPVIEYKASIFTLLNLCDMLISELRQLGNEKILNEINELLDQLFAIAKQQKVFPTLSETYLLKSKIALLQSQPTDARQYMEQARLIAEENGLLNLGIKISENYDLLLEQLDIMGEMIETNQSIIEKMEYIEIEKLILNMMKKKSEEISIHPEKPLMFLILSEEGKQIYRRNFQWGTEELMTIIDFINSIFSSNQSRFNKKQKERIKFGKYNLIIHENLSLYFIYVFEGQSYSPYRKMEALVEIINTIPNAYQVPKKSQDLSTDVYQKIDEFVIDLISPDSGNDSKIRSDQVHHENLASQNSNRNLSAELKMYGDILHPIRISILQLLSEEYRISRSDIIKLLSIKSGAVNPHLEFLMNKKIISKSQEFIDHKPRVVFYLEPSGSRFYNEFKESIRRVIDR